MDVMLQKLYVLNETPLVHNIKCVVVLCFLYRPQVGEKEMFGFYYY